MKKQFVALAAGFVLANVLLTSVKAVEKIESKIPVGAVKIAAENSVIVSITEPAAAAELKVHFAYITGKDVPIVKEKDLKPDVYPWYVGRVPPGLPADFNPRKGLRPEEGCWEVTTNAAYFYGARTKMAVFSFLEDGLGVRWAFDTNIAFRTQNLIVVTATKGSWAPELRIRNMRGKGTGLTWRMRLRDGGYDRPNYGHAFTKYWERYAKTRIDFFAMREDGKRLPAGCSDDVTNRTVATALNKDERRAIDHISMCVSSEDLVDQIVADWKAAGAGSYLNACENDSYGHYICFCEKCKALDEPKPADAQDWWPNWYADRYVNFANRILVKARKVRPDVKVVMYGYNATEQPPRREKLDKDIIVGLVPTIFSHEAIAKYINGWKQAGLNEFFYRPNRRCYYTPAYLPVGYEKYFFEIWQLIYKNGCIGFDYDGSTPKQFCYAGWFSDYVIHKAMTDPSKDFEYWENHYMQAFGPAAEDVKGYFRYWREEVWEKRLALDVELLTEKGKYFNFIRGLFWNLGKYYKAEDFMNAQACLDKALARTDLSEAELDRIDKIKFTNTHASLIYKAVVNKSEADSKTLLAFRRQHDLQLVPWYEEHFGDICGIKKLLALEK
ncbi:MAG: DUF4838 domain-containing protein [Kiritimatiellia bacterium]